MPAATTPKRTYTTLKKRLKLVGYDKKFVETFLVPEWWDHDCSKDAKLLQSVEFEVARFLSTSIEVVRDPMAPLEIPQPKAFLRAPKNTDKSRLRPAIHFGQAVAKAVVRNLSDRVAPYRPLPLDPFELRAEITQGKYPVSLSRLLDALWAHGIPVISVKDLPTPKFKAMACFAEGRPVILIGTQDEDEPKALTNLAHETGHVAKGHVTEDVYMVDGEETSEGDDDTFEKEAWQYHHTLIFGHARFDPAKDVAGDTGPQVREAVLAFGKQHLVDAAFLAHRWARGRHSVRKFVLVKLGKFSGAQGKIRKQMQEHLDLDEASETDHSRLQACLP